jgi:phage tail tape-measure protein
MRKILFATIAVAALAGVPGMAAAEDPVAGAVAGGAAGAAAGAVVGGPVGAAVGGAVGGTVGAGAASERRDREVIIEKDAPAVESKTCVTHADGTRVCREISR